MSEFYFQTRLRRDVMKKLISLTILVCFAAILVACGSSKDKENKKITIATSPAPHGEVLKHAKDEMKKIRIWMKEEKYLRHIWAYTVKNIKTSKTFLEALQSTFPIIQLKKGVSYHFS